MSERITEPVLSTLCLVADQFVAFATHPSVRTVSGFVAEVRAGRFSSLRGPLSICWGQGITAYDRDYVRDCLAAQGLLNAVLLESAEPEPVARSRSHKAREANVVLAGLVRTADDRYRAALRLHPDNELLLDHQTGEHLQGMVVIEAFRQMFISVCEQFVAVRWPERRYCYIWHGMEVRFENFLFPVSAEVDCRVTHANLDDPARLRMTMEFGVLQANVCCGTSRIDFTAYDTAKLAGKEHSVAGRTLDTVLAGAAHREELLEVG